MAAGKIGTHGMHDVTEGGVLGAVWEMCRIAGTGAELWVDKIPVKAVTKKICEHFDIDCMRLISSGCMLIMVAQDKKDAILKAMEEAGVEAAVIGRIREKEEGICMSAGGKMMDIDPPASDELYKVVGK